MKSANVFGSSYFGWSIPVSLSAFYQSCNTRLTSMSMIMRVRVVLRPKIHHIVAATTFWASSKRAMSRDLVIDGVISLHSPAAHMPDNGAYRQPYHMVGIGGTTSATAVILFAEALDHNWVVKRPHAVRWQRLHIKDIDSFHLSQ